MKLDKEGLAGGSGTFGHYAPVWRREEEALGRVADGAQGRAFSWFKLATRTDEISY
jgi:hypothetical protein